MTTKKESLENINKEIIKARKIDNNTYEINYKDGTRAIRLHYTDVITFKTNGDMILNSGGWRTPTTKKRIGKYSNPSIQITQKNSIWYIVFNNEWDKKFLYQDGIVIKKDGTIRGNVKNLEVIERNVKRVKKQIKNFVNLIDNLEKLPMPNNGDCWHCLFKTTEDHIPLGDKIKDYSHLKQHIKEKYIHGSLLVNALLDCGYRRESIGYIYRLDNRDTIKHCLSKYLQKRLLKEVL